MKRNHRNLCSRIASSLTQIRSTTLANVFVYSLRTSNVKFSFPQDISAENRKHFRQLPTSPSFEGYQLRCDACVVAFKRASPTTRSTACTHACHRTQ